MTIGVSEGGVTGPSPKIVPSHLYALCINCMWLEDLHKLGKAN